MKLKHKMKLLIMILLVDAGLLCGLICSMSAPVHVAALRTYVAPDTEHNHSQEGKCVALTFDAEVIIGLSQE